MASRDEAIEHANGHALSNVVINFDAAFTLICYVHKARNIADSIQIAQGLFQSCIFTYKNHFNKNPFFDIPVKTFFLKLTNYKIILIVKRFLQSSPINRFRSTIDPPKTTDCTRVHCLEINVITCPSKKSIHVIL